MKEKPEPLIGYEVNELDQYPIIGEVEVQGIPLAVRNIGGVTIYSRYGSDNYFSSNLILGIKSAAAGNLRDGMKKMVRII